MGITKVIGALILLAAVGTQSAEASGRFGRGRSHCCPTYSCQPRYSCAPATSQSAACSSSMQSSERTTLQNQINVLQQQIIDLDSRLRGLGG